MPDLDDSWRPLEPTSSDPWDIRKVAHLHRRAGFAAGWQMLQRDVADGMEAATDRLLNTAHSEDRGVFESVASGLRRGVRQGPDHEVRLQAYWLYRMLFSPAPLQERMTLFWHNHFATSIDKVQNASLMLAQNELLRRGGLGKLSDLFNEILVDSAMLIWLDGANSPKERPNENLAREFFELFSLGVGNYSESDIREAARALTGWTQDPRAYGNADLHFDPEKLDRGRKTVLGATGTWNAADIVDITLGQPACADFICRKLYEHFVLDADEAPPGLIESLAEELRGNDYSIRHVVAIILRSRHFYSHACIRKRIAGPVEWCVGLLRMLDMQPGEVRLAAIDNASRRQGQQLFHPPNVAGWSDGRNWITSTSLLERTNWLSDVIWGNMDEELPRFEPQAWAKRIGVAVSDLGEVILQTLLQGDHSARVLDEVMMLTRKPNANNLRKAIHCVVHAPEFQLV